MGHSIRTAGCLLLGFFAAFTCDAIAQAEVTLPAIFSEHMVLQRDQQNKLWGRAAAGESVTVDFAGAKQTTKADGAGNWSVMLAAHPAGGPHKLTIEASNKIAFQEILVGEVWICSGQSNMQWSVAISDDPDLEIATAKYPNIRLITVPNVGTQEPQWTFNGAWQPCSPQTVAGFSAVGYFFGRQLHETLDVPVGLINNAWGGSACEAWIRRDLLASNDFYKPLMNRWESIEGNYETDLAVWQEKAAEAKAAGKPAPGGHPDGNMKGNHRPANIYNGALKPTIGYGIRGAIWYQGESNAGRALQYREMFPLMIQSWRDEWGQGEFPFYWVQLADFMEEKPTPGESAWAELREAQTMTLSRLPHTGQAVIIDIGEGKDIHPRNKQGVAKRLARLALVDTYKVAGIAPRSPSYESMAIEGNKVILTFKDVTGGWRPFDVNELHGFTIAGADKKFVKATAKIIDGNKVEVSSPDVPEPKSVRYAWADNPVCNVFSQIGLPLTPFRTDDWPGVSVGN